MFSTIAEHAHLDFFEHLETLARIQEGDVLGRRDDHGAAHRNALRERELDVAGARRHVDDQIVELAPARVAQELSERLGDHRSAPRHGLLGVDHEAD